jgi:hypothetical protein
MMNEFYGEVNVAARLGQRAAVKAAGSSSLVNRTHDFLSKNHEPISAAVGVVGGGYVGSDLGKSLAESWVATRNDPNKRDPAKSVLPELGSTLGGLAGGVAGFTATQPLLARALWQAVTNNKSKLTNPGAFRDRARIGLQASPFGDMSSGVANGVKNVTESVKKLFH